jgi:hypothetical protein
MTKGAPHAAVAKASTKEKTVRITTYSMETDPRESMHSAKRGDEFDKFRAMPLLGRWRVRVALNVTPHEKSY